MPGSGKGTIVSADGVVLAGTFTLNIKVLNMIYSR